MTPSSPFTKYSVGAAQVWYSGIVHTGVEGDGSGELAGETQQFFKSRSSISAHASELQTYPCAVPYFDLQLT